MAAGSGEWGRGGRECGGGRECEGERKEREAISSVKVEASTKDTWSSGHALPATAICRASGTLRATENYIVV